MVPEVIAWASSLGKARLVLLLRRAGGPRKSTYAFASRNILLRSEREEDE